MVVCRFARRVSRCVNILTTSPLEQDRVAHKFSPQIRRHANISEYARRLLRARKSRLTTARNSAQPPSSLVQPSSNRILPSPILLLSRSLGVHFEFLPVALCPIQCLFIQLKIPPREIFEIFARPKWCFIGRVCFLL